MSQEKDSDFSALLEAIRYQTEEIRSLRYFLESVMGTVIEKLDRIARKWY